MGRAWVASLLVHAALLGGLALAATRLVATRRPPVPIEILVTHARAPTLPAVTPPRATAPRERAPDRSPKKRRRLAEQPAVLASPPEHPPVTPAAPEAASPLSMRGPAAPPSLTVGQLLDPSAIALVVGPPASAPAPDPVDRGGASDQGAQAQADVQGFIDDTEGRDRVAEGAVDPYYYDVSRRAAHYFRPSRAELAMVPPRAPGHALMAPWAVAPSVGPMSRFHQAVPTAPDAYNKWSTAVSQMGEVQGHLQDDPDAVSVELDVWIDRAGSVTRTSVLQSSGVADLDHDALRAVERAVAAIPRPASSGARPVETRWLCMATLDDPVTTDIQLVSVIGR